MVLYTRIAWHFVQFVLISQTFQCQHTSPKWAFECTASRICCIQEHDELEEVAAGQQPQKEKEKAGLLSKALRAPLGTRTLSLHNLLDQAPLIEGQQVTHIINLLESCVCSMPTCTLPRK